MGITKIQGENNLKLCISSLPEFEGVYECLGGYEKNIYYYVVCMDGDHYLNTLRDELMPIFQRDNLSINSINLFHYCYAIYIPAWVNMDHINIAELKDDLEIAR